MKRNKEGKMSLLMKKEEVGGKIRLSRSGRNIIKTPDEARELGMRMAYESSKNIKLNIDI